MSGKVKVVFDDEQRLINSMNMVIYKFEGIEASIEMDSKTILTGRSHAETTILRSESVTDRILNLFKNDIENLHSIAEEFEHLDKEISTKLVYKDL